MIGLLLLLLVTLSHSLQDIQAINTLFHRLEYKMDTNLLYSETLQDKQNSPTVCRIEDGPSCLLIN